MKQNLAYIGLLTITASTLLLAGCCTGRHGAHWEYKVAYPPSRGTANTEAPNPEVTESFLNGFAKEGWILVQEGPDGRYIFKRAMN